MRDPIPHSGVAQLMQRAVGDERVERTSEGDFYIWFGETPISASPMASGFGLKSLGAVGTNRNWNTAIKIAPALESMVE
jgi:uncharacterized protein (DUF1697 family)